MEEIINPSKIYNSTYEISIRVLLLLSKMNNNSSTINRLMIFDYLSLNTYDLGGPASLHAPVPNRGVQLYSRKLIIENSVKYLISKDLLQIKPSKNGLEYELARNGNVFLSYFESKYFNNLRMRIQWTLDEYGNLNKEELQLFIKNNLSKWGEEFMENENKATRV